MNFALTVTRESLRHLACTPETGGIDGKESRERREKEGCEAAAD